MSTSGWPTKHRAAEGRSGRNGWSGRVGRRDFWGKDVCSGPQEAEGGSRAPSVPRSTWAAGSLAGICTGRGVRTPPYSDRGQGLLGAGVGPPETVTGSHEGWQPPHVERQGAGRISLQGREAPAWLLQYLWPGSPIPGRSSWALIRYLQAHGSLSSSENVNVKG